MKIALPPRREPQSGGSGDSKNLTFLIHFWHTFLESIFGWILGGFGYPFGLLFGQLMAIFEHRFSSQNSQHSLIKKNSRMEKIFLIFWGALFDDFGSFAASGAWERQKLKTCSWEHDWEHAWDNFGALSLQQI